MESDFRSVLFRRDEIQARIRSLAAEIARTYEGASAGLTLVPVMSGAIIFLADLVRELPMHMKIALVHLSTYQGTVPGTPQVVAGVTGELRGRHVLIVDDILDTGRTLRRVQALLRAQEPASLRTAVLLRKPSKVPPDVRADFVGFDIDDLFVVGYGLDYNDHYRNCPHIGVLKPELLT